MFAKIVDGQVARFPYHDHEIRADHPGTSFPADLALADLSDFGIVLPIDAPEPVLAPGELSELGAPELVAGAWTRPRTIVAVSAERLAERERELHAQVDVGAGQFRLQFITDVPGQAATYDAKAKEAADHAAGGTGPFPFLTAEAQATGRALADVAAEVSATAAQWAQLGAAIEGQRIAAKRAVSAAKAAGDWAGMNAAAAVNWAALIE